MEWKALHEVEEDEAMEEHQIADAEMDADAEEEQIADAEQAPLAPPVEIWNLRAGQVLAINHAAGTFFLRAVTVTHASALESIITRKLQPGSAWVFLGLTNLTALSRFDLLLTVGIDAHLPILCSNLRTVQYLVSCRDWTWEIQTAATEFGGTFGGGCRPIKSVCQTLRKAIAGSLSLRRARTDDWLLEKLTGTLVDLRAFKAAVAFFPEV